MYATTMGDAEQRREETPCRLCLESTASHETAGIDLLENADVKKLLQDVYELEISKNDNSTMICMPCYQQLIKHYALRMKLLMLRKTFRINQTMMLTQINTFRGNSVEHSAGPKPDGNESTSGKEQFTQTEETASTTINKEMEKAHEKSDVTEPSSTTLQCNSNTTKFTAKGRQLIPTVVDCVKEPLYRNALWPLVVSTDRNDPAPLVLLCSTCHKSFKARDKFEQHQSKGDCVPCCRYCLLETTDDHSCSIKNKYSSIMPHIIGSSKYVTNNTIPESDDAGAQSDAHAEPDECQEAKKMKVKHSERVSSVERRSVTPNPKKPNKSSSSSSSTTKHPKSSEIRSQSDTTTISPSDELPVPTIIPHNSRPVDTRAISSRKRKRSRK